MRRLSFPVLDTDWRLETDGDNETEAKDRKGRNGRES